MENGKYKIILGVVLVILIIAGVFYWYIQPSQVVNQPEPNWYNEVVEGDWADEIAAAIKLAEEGRPEEAIAILEGVKSKVTNPGQKSVIDLTIANIYFVYIDKTRGAEMYAGIAGDTLYPAVSRAYAMLVVADQFDGFQDKNLLKPFFSDSEFTAQNKGTLIRALYQKIYDTHPFGLAAGKLAFYYLLEMYKGGTISDKDFEIVEKYITDINNNLIELEITPPFKSYIPVTILMKAALFRFIENTGRIPNESVTELYLSAIARARTLGISSTEQYGVLLYADYLAEKLNKDEAIKLLSTFLDFEINPMVKGTLASSSSMQVHLPQLYSLILANPSAKAVYQQILAD